MVVCFYQWQSMIINKEIVLSRRLASSDILCYLQYRLFMWTVESPVREKEHYNFFHHLQIGMGYHYHASMRTVNLFWKQNSNDFQRGLMQAQWVAIFVPVQIEIGVRFPEYRHTLSRNFSFYSFAVRSIPTLLYAASNNITSDSASQYCCKGNPSSSCSLVPSHVLFTPVSLCLFSPHPY